MTDVQRARDRMMDVHIKRRGVRDQRVLAAMRAVPRERFVEPGLEEFAYEDAPLPIAEEQDGSSSADLVKRAGLVRTVQPVLPIS